VPIYYRIYDKKDGQTKNDYFREMVREIREWGVKPRIVTGDIAILAGVVKFLPHPNPPLTKGRE
jgi:hypothetical protein